MPRQFVITKNSDIQDQMTKKQFDPDAVFNLPGYSYENIGSVITAQDTFISGPSITSNVVDVLENTLSFSSAKNLRFSRLRSLTGNYSSQNLIVEFFIKLTDYPVTATGYDYFISSTNPFADFAFTITNSSYGLGAGKLLLFFGGGLLLNSSSTIALDTWTHVSVIFEPTGLYPIRIFINGVQDLASVTPASPPSYTDGSFLLIGSNSGNVWNYELCGLKFKRKLIVSQSELSFDYLNEYRQHKNKNVPLFYSTNGPISLRGKNSPYTLRTDKPRI